MQRYEGIIPLTATEHLELASKTMKEIKLEQPELNLGMLALEIEKRAPVGADAARLVVPGFFDQLRN